MKCFVLHQYLSYALVMNGGVHWVKMGQNNDFLSKNGLKTPILAVMVLDQLTLEWAGTQNFKGIAISNMCFEKIGTSASK